jgi:hypothetical protein
MLQLIKRFLWIALLATGLQSSWAFSLLGPLGTGDDAWQVQMIGYNPLQNANDPPGFLDTRMTGPKNLGEEYRRNTPVMYYACNSTFLDFFGSNGQSAIDQAFVILNSLTNVDSYSTDLSEFPLQSQGVNFEANTLGLRDLKSTTLSLMMDQLGLADAVRYTWALHDRFQPANTICPNSTEYTVVMRNFDITASPLNQLQYSPYVNGTLFNYFIEEICMPAPGPAGAVADALEYPANPLDSLVNIGSVASGLGEYPFANGTFYTGLTRDDVAGLRYLLSSNNINTEAAATGSLLITTNISTPVIVTTLPIILLSQLSNIDPNTLLSTPSLNGLVISSVVTNYSFGPSTNLITMLTNPPIGSPIGTPPRQVVVTNVTQFSIITNYTYTFANIVTNTFQTNVTITTTMETFSISSLIGAPAGSPPVTNVVTTTTKTKGTVGDFFIVPTNWCGFIILTSSPPQNAFLTNVFATSTTNQFGTAQMSQAFSFTDHILIIEPELCTTTTPIPQLREGIERIQFVRADFDSLLGQFWQPVTNTYSMTILTNSQLRVQHFQRIVTAPDITFAAADLAGGPADNNLFGSTFTVSAYNFDSANAGAGLAGPGVINSPTTITYTKVGPVFENTGTGSLNGPNQTDLIGFIWGSFDESTNDPVVYPNGTSIQDLVNEALVQISPAAPSGLAAGTNGVPYPTITFTATGGSFSSPFTWSLVQGAGSLPLGLTLSPDGTISGTPTQSGTFDFVVQLTDSLGRSVQWIYSLTIN